MEPSILTHTCPLTLYWLRGKKGSRPLLVLSFGIVMTFHEAQIDMDIVYILLCFVIFVIIFLLQNHPKCLQLDLHYSYVYSPKDMCNANSVSF